MMILGHHFSPVKKNKKIALNNLNLDIQENDCIAVLGRTGQENQLYYVLLEIFLHQMKANLNSTTMIDTSYISGNERSFGD